MSSPGTSCPGIVELEQALSQGPPDDSLRAHLARCKACAARARQWNENQDFVAGLVDCLGADALERIAQERPAPAPIPALPNYQLTREIGRGAQGVLYEAQQLDTRRRVALKVVETEPADASASRRFRREAELAAGLRHPNVVTIYHTIALGDGRLALAMEYVDGLPFDEWYTALDEACPPQADARKQALRTKVRTVAAVCAAVHHAHTHGVIHRDLKPANVLIEHDATPRVVDFGIARRVSPGTQITRAGGFVGTLAYASPEQVGDAPDRVDTRSDVYALGLLLYESLVGRRPYDTASSLSRTIDSITHQRPAPLGRLQPGDQPQDPELEAIVGKALAKSPDERYQSAAALRSDLENWLHGRPVDARQPGTGEVLRKLAARHPISVSAGACIALVLLGLGVALGWSNHRLSQQGRLLEASLTRSTIERGRAAARAGENTRAEAMLWPTYVASGADATSPRWLFDESPEATRASWALIDLLSRHALVATIEVPGRVRNLAFTPDGTGIHALGQDGTIITSSVATGRSTRTLVAPWSAQATAQSTISSDARWALWSGADGQRFALDLTGDSVLSFDAASIANQGLLDISPDGTRLLVGGGEGGCELWSVSPLERIVRLEGDGPAILLARFSPDGSSIVGCDAFAAYVWDAGTGRRRSRHEVPADVRTAAVRGLSRAARMTSDNATLALAFHNQILFFDAQSDAPPRSVVAHRGFVARLEAASAAPVLLSIGAERSCTLWNGATGESVGGFEFGADVAPAFALSADGTLVALHDTPGVVRVYEATEQSWRRIAGSASGSVHTAVFSRDGAYLLTTGTDGVVRCFRGHDASPLWQRPIATHSLEALAVHPTNDMGVAAGPDGAILAFGLARDGGGDDDRGDDGARAAPARVLASGPSYTTWLGFDPAGTTLVAVGVSPDVFVIDAASGRVLRRVRGHPVRNTQGGFSPSGDTFYVVGSEGACIAFNTADWSERFRTPRTSQVARAVAVSPDGALLAVGGDDWSIRIFDARTGALVRECVGVSQHVFGLAFHPASKILFSCGRDGAIQVWDVRTGEEVARLEGHTDLPLCLALSPDGTSLVSGGADRAIRVWSLAHYRRHVLGSVRWWQSARAGEEAPAPK